MSLHPDRRSSRSRWLRAALWMVPPDWRESVERDLGEEAGPSRGADLWRALQIGRAGVSLRSARWARTTAEALRGGGRGLGTDVRLAFRLMHRERASTAAIIVTLALGIGATTATYAVFNTILFRPIPGLGDPSRLVTIDANAFSSRRLATLLRDTPGLDGPGVGYKASEAIAFSGQPEVGDVMVVTENYLRVLGVRAKVGRLISDEEALAGDNVAVVSERIWRTRFAAGPAVLGAPIDVNGERFTIVGVVDRYEEWGRSRVGTVVVWIPGGSGARLQARTWMRDTQLVVGRLQPGARVSVVEAEARGRFKAAIAQDGSSKTNVLTVRSGLHVDESEPIERQGLAVYRLSIGAGLLLLLLACANAANLLLARLARRERTFALCTAVGASRARVLRPVFVECACLAALATALGLGLASFVTRGLRGTRVFVGAPTLVDVPIDGRVVSFAVAIAAATLIAFTVLPALMGSRADARGLLQQAARGTSGRSRMRHALVVVQLALALALAAGAGELTRSMAYLRSLDLGMKPDGVVEFRLDAIQLAYGVGAKNRQFAKDVAASLAHLNGVTSVAVASPSVFDQEQFAMLIRPASAPPDAAPLSGAHRVVSSAYFATLGIPVVAGRAFADTEYLAGSARAGSPAILSESAARRLFGTPGGALGRHVTLSDARMATDPRRHDVEVVGVAGDTRTGFSYLREAVPAIYEPDNAIWGWSTFYLASGLPTPQAEETVRSAMHSLVPGMPILDVQTVREELDAMFPEERMIAMILRAIAAFAVALGLFGVAAVMASTLTERMRELGIRSALGASASQLVRDALRPALTLSLIGAACGLGAFALASRALVARVHGIAVWDPATLALTTSLLIVAALVAAWAPARRMSRIDPTIVLRIE